MNVQPELSRRVPLRRLGAERPETGPLVIVVEADADECAALALRLDVPAVAELQCRFGLSGVDRDGIVEAEGLLRARLTQVCVATAEAFEAEVTERFSLRFVPADRLSAQPDAMLDLDADDDVPYEGGALDLGEAAVEQLALALDPYPHRPGAERPAGVGIGDPPSAGQVSDVEDRTGDERPNPFAALSRLRGDGAN